MHSSLMQCEKKVQTIQRGKDVLDPSVLGPSDAINKAKIRMKSKNDGPIMDYYGIWNH